MKSKKYTQTRKSIADKLRRISRRVDHVEQMLVNAYLEDIAKDLDDLAWEMTWEQCDD